MKAHVALSMALAEMADRRERPPCASDPERWIGDDPHARALAATKCTAACPVVIECRAAGSAETHGVWGGIDRSKRTRERKSA